MKHICQNYAFLCEVEWPIFGLQADGQLLWKYVTGGTGGVCPLQGIGSGYSTDYRTLAAASGNEVTLDSSTASLPTGYYNGYR